MRTYACYLYYKNKENTLEKIGNNACFAGLNVGGMPKELSKTTIAIIKKKTNLDATQAYMTLAILGKPYRPESTICLSDISNEPKTIYIKDFSEPQTVPHMDYLISLVNKITPCEIVTIDKVQYLKVELLPTYNQSLIVLNFLRNLWHTPTWDMEKGGTNVRYTKVFFKELKNKYRDPLKKLLYANMMASVDTRYPVGHSNVLGPGTAILRTKTELLKATDMAYTQDFLTKKINNGQL